MKRIFVFLFQIILFLGYALSQTDTMTIKKCVEIALDKNPQVRYAEAGYESNNSVFSLNQSGLFPQVTFQSSAARNGGTFFSGPISRTGNYENYSLGFQANQLLFDFWKTYSRVSAYADLSDASFQDLKSVQQNIILNVYITYLAYLQSKRLYELNIEIRNQASEHLRQAKASYEIGKKPQFDVLKAESDLGNANLNVIKAENAIKTTLITLENAIGIRFKPDVVFKDNLETFDDNVLAFDNLLEAANKNRPEIIAAKLRIEASQSLLTSAWNANLPTINATGGYNWRSYEINQQFLPSWNIGVTLSMPIFQIGLFHSGIEQARANLKSSESSNESIAQAVLLDVQQQYLALEEAKLRISVSQKLVKLAEETLKLAEGRYNSDVGSAIEVTDARVTFLNAKVSYIQSLYDHHIASAKLKRAVGNIK